MVMTSDNSSTLLFIITAVLYYLAAVLLLLKPAYRRGFTRLLVGYLAAVGTWQLALIQPAIFLRERLTTYGFFLLALYLIYLTYGFLRLEDKPRRPWWAVGSLILLLLIAIDLALPSPAGVFRWQTLHPAWAGALLVGWSMLIGRTAVVTLQAHRDTDRRPLHRNRIRYWVLIIIFISLADLATLVNSLVLATIMRFLATILVAYTALTYRLVDIRFILGRMTSLVLTIILTGLFAIWGITNIWRWQPFAWPPIYTSAGLLLLLVLLFQPIQKGLQRLVDYLSAESDYDLNRTLREYSLVISSIMDLAQLEATAVKLISEAMEISYGTLFLVDSDQDVVGRAIYQLVSVQGFGVDKLVLGTFAANSPVAEYLAVEHRPLTQYDIDWQPRFQEITQPEREWLSSLGVEVFVPICTQERWIGLLGLGPKMAGTRYYDHDLLLLSTLADQTAVALENARLVADLSRVNRDLKQAYEDLAQANHHLQESDRLKSDFIGVITHEMRTPFAHIGFALQLLEKEGLTGLSRAQQEEFTKLKEGIRQAREMVYNLINFAAFVNKQRRLRPSRFDMQTLVAEVVQLLRPLAANKNIILHVNGASSLYLNADRERIGDAVHHLVHNAIKFTGSEGHVSIRTWQKNNQLFFAVKDNGPGVPADRLEQIWDGFSQMADPLRRGTEGIGLGLTLVKAVALAHNGDVFLRSEVGIGSTFGFWIPLS